MRTKIMRSCKSDHARTAHFGTRHQYQRNGYIHPPILNRSPMVVHVLHAFNNQTNAQHMCNFGWKPHAGAKVACIHKQRISKYILHFVMGILVESVSHLAPANKRPYAYQARNRPRRNCGMGGGE
jgi:hypothetical protein